MEITKKLSPNFSARGIYKPEIIVLHIMQGTLDGTTSWFLSPTSQVSSTYGVSRDGRIVQFVEESNMAWANGNLRNPTFKLMKPGVNPNLYTISIECAGNDLAQWTEEQLQLLRDLIRDVATRNSIPIDRDHIIGHFEIDGVNRPFCPSPDHAIVDRVVASLQTNDLVCVMCPKSKVELIKSIINALK